MGLTQSASRPSFSVVTGVSTGALIAPYAFLGPAWDDQLIEVYTSGRAARLLQSRGLGALFGSSVYRGEPLKELVDRYATDELIRSGGARGIDRSTAARGDDRCRYWRAGRVGPGVNRDERRARCETLFRDVLVASASVPGLFPPVVIRVRQEQALSRRFTLTARLPSRFSCRWLSSSRSETEATGRMTRLYTSSSMGV